MAPHNLILLSIGSLLAMLFVARVRDRARQRGLEELLGRALSPEGRHILEGLLLGIHEQEIGLKVLRKAVRDHDAQLLRRAVGYVEGFAPSLREGLQAVRQMSRSIAIIVDLPPMRPMIWRAWQLRELALFVRLMNVGLVAGAERMRLRVWFLGRALHLCLRWLGRASKRADERRAHAWRDVESAIADLTTVGTEASVAYERVIRSLDAVDELARRTAPAPAGSR